MKGIKNDIDDKLRFSKILLNFSIQAPNSGLGSSFSVFVEPFFYLLNVVIQKENKLYFHYKENYYKDVLKLGEEFEDNNDNNSMSRYSVSTRMRPSNHDISLADMNNQPTMKTLFDKELKKACRKLASERRENRAKAGIEDPDSDEDQYDRKDPEYKKEGEFLVENKDTFNEIEDNILTSLSRISLQRESHPIILQKIEDADPHSYAPKYHIERLIYFIQLSVDQLKEIKYCKETLNFKISYSRVTKIYSRILKCLRTITNCMMYCSVNYEFLSKGSHFERVIEFLILTQTNGLNYGFQEEQREMKSKQKSKKSPFAAKTHTAQNSKDKTPGIFDYIKEIKSECKVALLLIENYNTIRSKDFVLGKQTVIKNEIIKIDFLMKSISKNSEHLTCKSLACLDKMLMNKDHNELNKSMRNYLIDGTKFIKRMEQLLDSPHACIVRETCRVLSSFVARPDGMILWLRFDSTRLGIDSS